MNTDILTPLIPFLLGLFSIIIGVTYTKEDSKINKKLGVGFFSYFSQYIPVWIFRIVYVLVGIMLIAFAIIGWM